MRSLVLLSLLALTTAPSEAQGRRPTGSTTLLSGPGAIGAKNRLGYHVNARHRLLDVSLDALAESLPPLRSLLSGSVSADGEAFYQRGLVTDGTPWLLGTGLVTRWSPFPETWAVRPYFLPVTAGLFVEGPERSTATRAVVGIGNGFGIEVPVGRVAVSVEVRAVRLRGRGGTESSSAPVSVGLTF